MIMKKYVDFLISQGYEELERDESNILLINKDKRLAVILMEKFDFKSSFTNDAIKLQKKHQEEYRFIEKKTFAFIVEFLDSKKKILNDEYFFMKNAISDLKPVILWLHKKIKIIIKISDNLADMWNYISNSYISSVSENRDLLHILSNTDKEEFKIIYPVWLSDRSYYFKYLMENTEVEFIPITYTDL